MNDTNIFNYVIPGLQSLDMEPFTVYPELSSTYVFARSPKNEKEMVFVERVIFPRLTDFYT